jgi:hypothetical protein
MIQDELAKKRVCPGEASAVVVSYAMDSGKNR